MTSTAVIAHYNAAVELEYLHLWQEAQDEYETAQSLARIGLESNNPIQSKINKALAKVHMKVRNKVQLPPKRQPKLVRVLSSDGSDDEHTQKSVFKTKRAVSTIPAGPLSLREIINKLDTEARAQSTNKSVIGGGGSRYKSI